MAGIADRVRLGTLGYTSCFVLSFLAAVLAPGWNVLLAFGMALLLALVFYRGGLAPFRMVRVWVFIALLLIIPAVIGGFDEFGGWSTELSRAGFATGIQMVLRAVAILVTVSGFAACVSIGELAALLEHVGMPGLGFALGVAVNILPMVQETATTTYQALRLRGGFQKKRWQAFRLLLITIMVNTLRHAEDIVCAAEARAFSTAKTHPQPLVWRPRELVLTSILALATIALVWF